MSKLEHLKHYQIISLNASLRNCILNCSPSLNNLLLFFYKQNNKQILLVSRHLYLLAAYHNKNTKFYKLQSGSKIKFHLLNFIYFHR